MFTLDGIKTNKKKKNRSNKISITIKIISKMLIHKKKINLILNKIINKLNKVIIKKKKVINILVLMNYIVLKN